MKIRCFGIAKDITSQAFITIDEQLPSNVEGLKLWLEKNYPQFKSLNKCMIAVNQEYADDNTPISTSDEIAIIPPVSGG